MFHVSSMSESDYFDTEELSNVKHKSMIFTFQHENFVRNLEKNSF